MASFGAAYADQTAKDFEEFIRAIRVGKIRTAKLAPTKAIKSAKPSVPKTLEGAQNPEYRKLRHSKR
jgi:hypothetical protein